MTPADPKAVRTSFERVQEILHRDWDPIGCGAPLDEYDRFAWSVLKLLQRQASREEVQTYLRLAADQAMQSPVREEMLAAVVDRLMAL